MSSCKIPVFPNWFPYNDMLLDGHLEVEHKTMAEGTVHGVKTRSWNWDYRGPVLLYNSGRTAREALEAYGYSDCSPMHRVIVGIGNLYDVRPLTDFEGVRMVANFNNIRVPAVRQLLEDLGRKYGYEGPLMPFEVHEHTNLIAPLPIGFFFNWLDRFENPVSFRWPPGPIRPIMTTVRRGGVLWRQMERVKHFPKLFILALAS